MTCSDSVVHEIEHVLETHANRHPYPIMFGKHEGTWLTTIEVDSPKGTFDIESKGSTLTDSMRNALTALRREFSA